VFWTGEQILEWYLGAAKQTQPRAAELAR
jgi:hypothetical protein